MNSLFIPLEVINRELRAKLALAAHCASRGYRVIIGHKWYVTNFALNSGEAGDFYLERGTYLGESTPIYKKLKMNGIKIISYDEEGGLNFRDYPEYANRYNFASYISTFDAWLTWGPRDFAFFKVRAESQDIKTEIGDFGVPRGALWNLEKRYFAGESSEAEEQSPLALLATNFVYSNSILQDPEMAFANVDKAIQIRILHDLDFGKKNNLDEINYQRFHEAIKLLLTETNLDILVRPHPVENDSHYSIKLVKEFDSSRVNLDKSTSITDLLKKSKILIHGGSTTSIEATVYSIPSISLENFLFAEESMLPSISNVFCFVPKSTYELQRIIQNVNLKARAEGEEAIKEVLWLGDTLNFYNKFVQLIRNLSSNSESQSQSKGRRLKANTTRILMETINLRLKSQKNLPDRTKRPKIKLSNLRKELGYVSWLLGIESRFKIRKLDRSTFQIGIDE